MNKKRFITLLLALSSLLIGQRALASTPSGTPDPVTGYITDTDDCTITPDQYYMTVYRVGLGNSLPAAPTTSSPIDFSGFVTVFESSSGWREQVKKGISAPLTGTKIRPPSGTYTFAYVELAPKIEVKAKARFNTARWQLINSATYTNGTYNNYKENAGAYFWSKNGSTYNWGNPPFGLVGHGATVDNTTYAVTKHFMNSIATDSELYSADFKINGVTASAYLVNSSYKLASGAAALPSANPMGDIARIIAIMPVTLTVTAENTGLNISFNVSNGSTIHMNHPSNSGRAGYTNGDVAIDCFGAGPFEPIITVY
ncbi:MAG: hypothetical protein WCH05_04130 [Chlorobiaceae bacterium]